MRLIEAWYRVTASFRRRRLERDLEDEIAFHLSMREASGLPRIEARRRFGNPTVLKERMRDMWTFTSLESVLQDFRYAARTLRKQPGFAFAAVLLLASVTGLNTSLLTMVNALALHPPAGIANASGVAALYPIVLPGEPPAFTAAEFRYLADHARTIDLVGAAGGPRIALGPSGDQGPAKALIVSGNFFQTLGIPVIAGRGFQRDDDRIDAPRAVAVIGAGLWETRFGRDAGIVGRAILLNNVPFTVIGIASRDFVGMDPAVEGAPGVFLPVSAMPLVSPTLAPGVGFVSDVAGRMQDGSTYAAVRAEADVLLHQFHTAEHSQPRKVIVTSTAFLSHPGRSPILLLFGMLFAALMLVWLLGCANVGNLQLARAAARAQEIGIRLSLGASRARVVRQLLTEGLVLALAAGALGVAIAYALPSLAIRFVGDRNALDALNFSLAPDGLVMLYAVLLAAASSAAFALAPALHVTRSTVASALRDRDGLPSSLALRNVLLAVQVAVSVVVLVAAGLLMRRVQKQATFDPGIPLDDVAVVSFMVQGEPYDLPRTKAFLSALETALRQHRPGTFGFTTHEPFTPGNPGTVRLTDEPINRARPAGVVEVTSGYLSVLRAPFVAGRNFADGDAGRPVALVNETMARWYWPAGDAVGKTLIVGNSDSRAIVGVVRNLSDGMNEPFPMVYRPLGSTDVTGPARDAAASGGRVRVIVGGGFATLVVRGSAASLADEIGGIVRNVDAHVRVQSRPLAAAVEERRRAFRTGPMLAGLLGIFALALATAGMFGVFAYAVRQRTREIGIRMALGARSSDVVRLILAGQGRAVGIGLVVGLAGGVGASQGLRGFLGGVSPFDPVAYLGVAAVLAVAGLLASYVPARRATRINPIEALRCD